MCLLALLDDNFISFHSSACNQTSGQNSRAARSHLISKGLLEGKMERKELGRDGGEKGWYKAGEWWSGSGKSEVEEEEEDRANLLKREEDEAAEYKPESDEEDQHKAEAIVARIKTLGLLDPDSQNALGKWVKLAEKQKEQPKAEAKSALGQGQGSSKGQPAPRRSAASQSQESVGGNAAAAAAGRGRGSMRTFVPK